MKVDKIVVGVIGLGMGTNHLKGAIAWGAEIGMICDTDPEKLKEELAAIRERGYSLDDEEFGYGIVCMSVPVYDYTGEAIGVIGCSVSTIYCDANGIYDYCGEKLMETARQISKCMGYVLQ